MRIANVSAQNIERYTGAGHRERGNNLENLKIPPAMLDTEWGLCYPVK